MIMQQQQHLHAHNAPYVETNKQAVEECHFPVALCQTLFTFFRISFSPLLALGAQLVFGAVGLANFFLVHLAQYQVY